MKHHEDHPALRTFCALSAHPRHPTGCSGGDARIAGGHRRQPGCPGGFGPFLSAARRVPMPGTCCAHWTANATGLTDAEARSRCAGPDPTRSSTKTPALVDAPRALLWQPVQPAVDGSGGHWATDDTQAASVITSMVAPSTGLRFWQERCSHEAADRLKSMVSSTATVLRRGRPPMHRPVHVLATRASTRPPRQRASYIEVPIRRLAPGEVLQLSAGDMIPADLRLLAAKDLFVGQSAMTGESPPVEKFPQQRDPQATNPLELDNILFMAPTWCRLGHRRGAVHRPPYLFRALAQRGRNRPVAHGRFRPA